MNPKVKAEQALAMHLCSAVFPPQELMPAVMAIAKQMAKAPPLALKRIKQNLNDADELTHFSVALDRESDRHARTAYHPDAQEAGAAFIPKRAPKFSGVGNQHEWASSKL